MTNIRAYLSVFIDLFRCIFRTHKFPNQDVQRLFQQGGKVTITYSTCTRCKILYKLVKQGTSKYRILEIQQNVSK